VGESRIFCSSIEGYGITAGHNFLQYILDQLQNTPLVVPLITPAYLDSLFCQWELGGAWVREVDMVPILVDPVRPDQLQGPLQNRQVVRLDQAGLNALVDRIAERVGSNANRTRWERERDKLIADLPDILSRLRTAWAGTTEAVQRRAARVAAQSEHLHQVFHCLRDTAALKILHRSNDRRHFLTVLGFATGEIARCFTGMTGHDCRATIKQVLDKGGGVPGVVDLSRSGTTPLRRTPESIADNTDFEELMVGTRSFFMCNNIAQLQAAGTYKNSHSVSGQALSYNSTVVWPVRKIYEDQPPAGISDWQDIVAYLCVDSAETDVFVQSDVWVGAAIADAMWSVLRPWVFPPDPIEKADALITALLETARTPSISGDLLREAQDAATAIRTEIARETVDIDRLRSLVFAAMTRIAGAIGEPAGTAVAIAASEALQTL
jgi:hypothetical protein